MLEPPRLVPQYDPVPRVEELGKEYSKHQFMEEATVELLAQEICKQNNVEYKESYKKEVRYLRAVNKILKIGEDEFEFAQKLFDIDMTMRYNFLRDVADKKISNNEISHKNVGNLQYLISLMGGGLL